MRVPLLSFAPALAALLIAGPAAAGGNYYTWKTEEGATAFTDDPRAIPEAYRSHAQRRSLGSLRGYERLTPADARASTEYARRLDARLAYLRERSEQAQVAGPERQRSGRASAPAIALRTGGESSPLLEVTPLRVGESDEPVIVETLRAHPADRIVTRNNTVVRQGDRVLAIVRSRGREINVNEDIHVEEELE
jgi:hypothetical protein